MATTNFSPSEHRATSYAYQPLDHATQSIRLIRLQPASTFDSDVHCDIYPVSLDANPDYEALSYAWGDAAITAPIFLQGCSFQATVNLVSALRHLRYHNKARTLWVDAICIDQSNVQERGHQVAFMARIYSAARCDVLWLGDDPDNEAEVVFKFMEKIARILQNNPADGNSKAKNKVLNAAASLLVKGGAPISAMTRILRDRPVWNRIWIIQEIVVSRSVSIHCGLHSVIWECLSSFTDLVVRLQDVSPRSPDLAIIRLDVVVAIIPAFAICSFRIDKEERLAANKSISILEMWEQFYNFMATDPRDKIFAVCPSLVY
jgi:Heterokaryon incompatibility protein (HET)